MLMRIMAPSFFAVALLAGCSAQQSGPPPEARIAEADMMRIEAAVKKAEAAAERAEVAAEKAEVIFNKSLRK